MNKKQITILAIGVLAVVAIYWFFFRNKKDETKKESSFNDDYLVKGDEMGYKKCCDGICIMEVDNQLDFEVTTVRYKCCLESNCGTKVSKRTASSNYNGKGTASVAKERELGSKENCKDSKGNKIPCPEKINSSDIVSIRQVQYH
jgi:hypothetical protein